MQKRHLVLALVMLIASAVSYELVNLVEAGPSAIDVVEAAGPTGIATAAPVVAPPPAFLTMFESVSDAAILFTTGATLLVIAAGVRRRAC